MQELSLLNDTLAHERNFYFNKLREVELLCQNEADDKPESIKGFKEQILGILHAVEDGFTSPGESEEYDDNNLPADGEYWFDDIK